MGNSNTILRFFLLNLGEHKAILGYPWFTATQPQINWKRGWIDHMQLPIILRAPNTKCTIFIPRTCNIPNPVQRQDRYFLGQIIVHDQILAMLTYPKYPMNSTGMPKCSMNNNPNTFPNTQYRTMQ
jgi:hypothetical protein